MTDALKTQVGGDHYTKMGIQPMEYSMANKLDACQHTIIKYVSRFRDKNGIQDLEKAKHVIDMLIEFEKRREAAEYEQRKRELVSMTEQMISAGGLSTVTAGIINDKPITVAQALNIGTCGVDGCTECYPSTAP
jgi:hypothetical protein